ncbi:unnamed protein product (macronuclear) [Paramecium tetraurelia]|uniref:Uncharacterized protein n=1 Tax=Paramecium tetraurelia TaxID=5888 RepID=A0CB60_PARTE|nr:uncharacterized protein GSPATT00036810001 [Paramecium tetraurelia]CAK68027.1 unnamed protein product [Paramecium tetraurelia]|eukprot:XP_001435424.1 hypothetical protein (macronuclear) [Paramecium tetraurelia strain d4-2]
MSTIEKQIQKQRKLSHEFEQTYNSTEIHSNLSFFDEERSQDFDDDSSLIEEDFQEQWEMSSICTENSLNPQSIEENPTNKRFRKNLTPKQALKRGGSEGESIFVEASDSTRKNTNSGKGIAIDVLGHGSIGTQSKKVQKSQKLLNKQLQCNNNNNININNSNNSWQQQPYNQYQNYNSQSQSQQEQQQQRGSAQDDKQIKQTQKITLSYLLMEREIEKQARIRALNFIEKYMAKCNVDDVLQMISETYKIMLIPDQQLQQLVAVLNQQERQLQLNQSLLRLRLPHNSHPLASKAQDKLRKYFIHC